MGLDNPIHIAFLLILLLLVFGAKRLPEMGRSLGSGMRGFKESLSGENAPSTLTAPQQESAPAVVATQAVAPAGVPAAAPVAAPHVGAPVAVPAGTSEIPAA